MRSLAPLLVIAALVAPVPFMARAATTDVSLPLCSAAVHDEYRTKGPDGQWYPSWHPQIDHYAGCHFDHEHGSSPALFGPVSWPYGQSIVPAYGYTAARAGMSEGHAGFKTYVFRMAGYTWMLSHHFGTANPQVAACARFHTFDLVISDGTTVKVDIHFAGDYGPATANNDGPDLTPTACPTQAADARAAGSNGIRQIPVTADAVDYEPWRLDTRTLSAIGFRSGAFTLNTNDPQKACATTACDSGVPMVLQPGELNRGVERFFTFNAPSQGAMLISGTHTGSFYTDPTGMQSRAAVDPDSVRQYIAPGFTVTVGAQEHGRLANGTGTDGMYWCAVPGPSEATTKLNRLVTGPN